MRHIVTVFLFSCTALFSGCQNDEHSASPVERPSVASTIKPLQALVYAIAHPMLNTTQLIPDNASPHHYQARPSTLRQLQQAAVIFRIDAQLESQFSAAFTNLTSSQQLITLSQSNGIQRLAQRQNNETKIHAEEEHEHHAGEGEEHEHHAEEEEEEEHEHEHHSGENLHIWLNPMNGIAMANTINQVLSQRFPAYAEQFNRNTLALITKIKQKDQQIRQQLAPIQQKAFITFHDAWQYFDTHYQLRYAGSITTSQLQQFSAKHLQMLREKTQQQQVTCLFHEPQFSQHSAETLSKDLTLNTASLDPLGSHLSLSADTYPALLQGIADNLLACLQPKK